MAETRTSTTWDIKINARALRGLQKTLGQVFSKQTPREFNTAVGQVNRSLEVNARRTNDIVTAMAKVERGTKVWKRLSTELKEANKEGRALERTILNLDRAQARVEGRTRDRLGRFVGGGVAGPPGVGMGAPGPAGRGLRGLPQAPMPGIGAMQTALSAIPVAGLAAAGSMMAAAQTYQSRQRFEQARLAAAPYLMSSREALGFQPTTRTVQLTQPGQETRIAGRLVQERGTGAIRQMGEAGLTTGELGGEWRKRRRQILEQRRGGGVLASIVETGLATGVEEISGLGRFGRGMTERRIRAEQRGLEALTGTQLAEVLGTEEQATEARRVRAEALAAADPAVLLGQERRAEATAGRAATARVRQQPFDDAMMRQMGVRMGFAPAETMQIAAQLGQAAGRPVSPQEMGQAMALQRTLGLGAQQTGGMIRQLRYAGEISGVGAQQGSMEEVANLIGDAVAMGLEGSEIADFLQQQTGFLGQMAQQGVGVNIEQQRNLEATIRNSGAVIPWRVDDLARQFTTGASRIGREGAQSAEQFRLMRAFGFTGAGGMEEFFRVRMGMQSQELGQQMGLRSPAEAMSRFIEEMRVEGAGPAMQAGVLQRAFQGVGMTIGPEEALRMAQGMQATQAGGFQIDTQAAERLVATVAPSARAEAGIQAERVAIGAQVAGAMQDLQRTTNNMAGLFTNVLGPATDAVASGMNNLTQALETATAGVWVLGPPASVNP